MIPLIVFNIVRWTVSAMPVRMGYFVARKLAGVHYRFFPGRRSGVLSNVRHVLTDSPSPRFRTMGERQVAELIFRRFNGFLFEFFRMSRLRARDLPKTAAFKGLHHVDAALAKGKGVIVATAHIGNWEFGGLALSLLGYRLHVVAGVQFSKYLSEHVKNLKRRHDINVVSPEEGYRVLFRALHNNEVVVLLVDGDVFVNGLSLDFFSRPARIPSGAAALSLRTGAPIVPGYVRAEGGFRFEVVVDEPIFPHSTGNKSEDVEKLTRQVLSKVESYIEENLDQWCIFREIWSSPAERSGAISKERAENDVLQDSVSHN
ncbi:MAG: lysophospholipid acyltransferase family protein [Candidatus Eisenbacteria bacterium]